MGHRLLVGAFSLEGNSFAEGVTSLDDFRAFNLVLGEDVTASSLGDGSELAGAWSVFAAAGCSVVPTVAAWTGPRPRMSAEALDAIEEAIVSRVDASLDGVYLMLHGSAVAVGEDDPEGRILAAVRERLGSAKPIAISLDHHACLTRRMLESVDAIAAYRTCPHVDTFRTGEQAGRLLLGALDGRVRPVVREARRPMVTPPQFHDNSLEPFGSIMGACDEAETRPGVLAAAVLPVTPWLDHEDLCWKAVVTADGDAGLAERVADELIERAWRQRRAMIPPPLPGVAEALEAALAMEAPAVFADTGDATNGGSPGDSTELLRAALALPPGGGQVLLSVRDPAAAAALSSAAVGDEAPVSLAVGAPGAYNERTSFRAVVLRRFDAEYRHTHPVNRGYRAETGPGVVLRAGRADVVVHTRSALLIDDALYRAAGCDPAAAAVVQAKSHVTFIPGFLALTDRHVLAGTNGPCTAELRRLAFARRPSPLFPFEDVPDEGPAGGSPS